MPDILIRGMEMPKNCFQCPLFSNCDACEGHECECGLLGCIGYEDEISEDHRRDDCPLVELQEQTVETNIYDQEEIHPNCTVQILKNSVTGEVSVGWWENEDDDSGN